MRLVWRAIRTGVKDLLLHKLRSILTVLGVFFGVGSVVAMLAVGEGASAQALERIRRLGSHNILLTATKAVEDEAPGQIRRVSIYGLTYDDEKRLRECFPTVRRIVPAKIVRKEGRLGERALEVRVVGTTPEWFDLVPRRMLAGRHLAPYDVDAQASVCVLTESGARKLLAVERSIGSHVRIGNVAFEVIGIVESEVGKAGDGIPTPDQEVDAYIPLTVCRARFGDMTVRRTSGSFEREMVELHQVIVEVDDTASVEPTANAIKTMLERFHKRVDYKIGVPLALLREAEATKKMFNIVLGSIAGISLIVGGIGIMNIMLASVTERTREIGIRRAIGAKKRQIMGQFLIEAVVLSVVGGLAGLLLGVAFPAAVEYFFGMPTDVTPFSVLLALGISGAVGIVSGIYPARRAADLDPIVALRHE